MHTRTRSQVSKETRKTQQKIARRPHYDQEISVGCVVAVQAERRRRSAMETPHFLSVCVEKTGNGTVTLLTAAGLLHSRSENSEEIKPTTISIDEAGLTRSMLEDWKADADLRMSDISASRALLSMDFPQVLELQLPYADEHVKGRDGEESRVGKSAEISFRGKGPSKSGVIYQNGAFVLNSKLEWSP